MNSLEISVLLCTYNGLPYLSEAIMSVLKSQDVDLELVVVNDGSTDETLEYLEAIVDSRLKVVHLPENVGVAAAANQGLPICKAPYIARMDADDWIHPEKLKKQVDYLNAHPEVDAVACTVKLTETKFDQRGYQFYVDWTNKLLSNEAMRSARFRDSPIVNPSIVMRSSMVEKLGPYRETGPEDYEYWLRAWKAGMRLEKISFEGLLWRDHESRLTRNHQDYSSDSFHAVKLEYFLEEWSGERPLWLWGVKKSAKNWYKGLTENGVDVAGFVDFKSGSWKGLPVLSIEEALQDQSGFILINVQNRVGAQKIEEALMSRGRQPGLDYYLV